MKKDIRTAEITGNEIVVQDNRLIDSRRTLSLQEQKLFLFLVSKLDPNKKEDITFRITIEEFAKAIGVESKTDVYRDVKSIIKRLMTRVISIKCIKYDNTETTKDFNIISYAEYWHGKGFADIKISETIAPYLFDLKREYTQYKLIHITELSSLYAMRMYEMLKKQEKMGKRTFLIDALRKALNIIDKQYTRFNDFKTRVLDIAKKEINEKTDITIDYEFVKTSRKITEIQFDIKPKNDKEETIEEEKEQYATRNETRYAKCLYEIVAFGFSQKAAAAMLTDMADYEIENAIAAVKNQIKKGNVRNPKAMLKTALKEKWSDNEKNPPRSEEIVQSSQKAVKNKAIKKPSKSEEVTPKPKKPVKNGAGFLKIFDGLFKR